MFGMLETLGTFGAFGMQKSWKGSVSKKKLATALITSEHEAVFCSASLLMAQFT